MTHRIRVLFGIGSLAGGGSERQMIGILQHLDRRRFEPALYLVHPEGELLGEVPDDVPVISYWQRHRPPRRNVPGLIHFRQVRDLARTIVERNIEVVCDHNYFTTLIAGPATRRTGVPRVSVVVNDPQLDFENSRERFARIKRRLLRRAYHEATRVVGVSDGVCDALSEYFQLPREKLSTVYNFVDIDRIDRLAAEDPPPLDAQHFHIVTAGRLQAQKGYAYLLEAIDDLVHRRGHDRIRLHLLGQGPLEAQFRRFIEQRALADHVRLPGFVSNPFRVFRAAQLFCLSSLYEGMPHVLVEALACRIPVVSTDCPSGPGELLAQGQFGTLVRPADAGQLADAIDDAILHYDRWLARVEPARQRVERDFSFRSGIGKVELLLEDAARRR
jgi:glycosyltransferase involved in cell wall biosynthesis